MITIKIFIDAGHNDSSWNTGAVGNGLKEQDITFNVSKLLSEILQKYGVETKLSRRTKETNLGTNNSTSINARYRLANEWKADYFISIHANAGGGTGAETLYHKADSLAYATVIQTEYVKAMGLVNRGIKYRDDVGVIMHTNMPAVLIELAFIDTYSDSLVLRDKQKSMAQAVANGFIKFLGLKLKETEETEVLTEMKLSYKGKEYVIPSILKDGLNYPNLRELAKILDVAVGWDSSKNIVILSD